jgi:hypothetical protein
VLNHIIMRPDQAAECIRFMERGGDTWHVPLLQAVQRGELGLLNVLRGNRAPRVPLDPKKNQKPLAVIICDDFGPSMGPSAFPAVQRLFRWAKWIMLHGAGGEGWHYEMAAEATLRMRRCLIVETTSAGLPAWAAFKLDVAPKTPFVCFRVPDASHHPMHGSVEAMQ